LKTHTPGPYEAVPTKGDALVEFEGQAFQVSHVIETVDKTIHEGQFPAKVGLVVYFEEHVYPHLGSVDQNAALFALAPKLLDALKECLPLTGYQTEYDGRNYDICALCGGQDGECRKSCKSVEYQKLIDVIEGRAT
jgi:hypothetical protein